MRKRFIGLLTAAVVLGALAFGAFAPAAEAGMRGDKATSNTIVDVALAANAESGEFSILIAALQAADPSVIEALNGKKQLTVFAPTDAAFGALLAELDVTAEALLGDQALLTDVLLYHVAGGNLDSEDVLASDRIRTLQGGKLLQDTGVLTDANGRDANIVALDIEASNGVIHVIDRVVLPGPKSPPKQDDGKKGDDRRYDDNRREDNDKRGGQDTAYRGDDEKGHGDDKSRRGDDSTYRGDDRRDGDDKSRRGDDGKRRGGDIKLQRDGDSRGGDRGVCRASD